MQLDWDNKYIVFFDGDCGVCNFWVQWILERDKKDRFLFASLQSEAGQQFLTKEKLSTTQFNTLYLLQPDAKYLLKSRAVLKIATLIGGAYSLLGLGRLMPRFVSDYLYDKVSENRMKISSQKCFLPDADQKRKFIDI